MKLCIHANYILKILLRLSSFVLVSEFEKKNPIYIDNFRLLKRYESQPGSTSFTLDKSVLYSHRIL